MTREGEDEEEDEEEEKSHGNGGGGERQSRVADEAVGRGTVRRGVAKEIELSTSEAESVKGESAELRDEEQSSSSSSGQSSGDWR